jgi:hypothetical protein
MSIFKEKDMSIFWAVLWSKRSSRYIKKSKDFATKESADSFAASALSSGHTVHSVVQVRK